MSEVTRKPTTGPAAASPGEVPTIWTTGWTDVFNTGTWRAATPIHEWRPSPCHADCPIGNTIPGWIADIREGAYQEAWLSLVETNPFPSVTGRVCHHPCEGHCNREVIEAVVGINGLEHFLGDRALEEGWALPAPAESQGKRVAVVGGGPAGLSCAYHLRRLGYEVTIYEAREELGGLLRYGIPEYRLAAGVVDAEIARLLDMGIEVRLNAGLADRAALESLEAEYDAVFLAVGAQQAKILRHLEGGAGAGRVLDGLEYLRRCTEGVARDLGERMTVIGGGSAAMDVARSARRLGHQVSVVALESRGAMPAQPEEIEQALEEGVALFDGAMVAAVEAGADGGLTLKCVKVTLDLGAPAGELRPVPVEGGEFALAADVIVTAIGQDPDLAPFNGAFGDGSSDGSSVDGATGGFVECAVLVADPVTLATTRAGVFAGGDVASTNRFVSEAIGAGRRAAYSIAEYLSHPDACIPERPKLEDSVNRTEVNSFYFEFSERRERVVAPAAERLQAFAETISVYSTEDANAEAGRCMSCGFCVQCDNCFVFCPDMAVQKDPSAAGAEGVAPGASECASEGAPPAGAAVRVVAAVPCVGAPADSGPFYFVLDQYCKGCGLCVTECPRGAVRLEQVNL
ncbi:MAG: FAD-dependent oxidoreductase [Actinobacteria bacterium]|nr:FAD-dependent oxidoreductase [Actinomycetota bacterium]